MSRARLPDLYVLDTLADDIEDLATMMCALNSDTSLGWHRLWGRHFTREEIIPALSRLIKGGLVQVASLSVDGKSIESLPAGQLPPGDYDDVWFLMTSRGRLVHSNWDPERPEDDGGIGTMN